MTKRLTRVMREQKTSQTIDLAQCFKMIAEGVRQLAEQLKPIIEEAVHQSAQIEWERVAEFFKQIAEAQKVLPERTRKSLLALSQRGWFFDVGMPATSLYGLKEAATATHMAETENEFVDYFRKSTNEIIAAIGARFPARAKILNLAFAAHQRGEYELSILAFLAQADGISQELFGIQFCQMRSTTHNPAVKKFIQQSGKDEVWAAFFFPLMQPLPISKNAKERGPEFSDLNRHQVMHGESVNYGSEINSLKALSLLNYVAVVLPGEWDKGRQAAAA